MVPAGDAETASDHDQVRREDVREGAHPGAEVAADPGQDLTRLGVALVREPDEPVGVGGWAEGLTRRRGRGEARDIGLEVPAAPAGSLAGAAVVDDHDVAELDAAAARAAKRSPARYDTAAEPGSHGQHDEVVDAAAGAGTPFADCGRVRVVVEARRQAEPLRHVVAKGEVREGQVHALDDHPVDLVDRGRRAEADRGHLVVEQLRHGGLELANDGRLRVLRRRALVPADDGAVPRDDAGEDLRAAEVHPDRVTAVHPQRVPYLA